MRLCSSIPTSQGISFVLIKLSCSVQLASVADSCGVNHCHVLDMLLSQTAAFGAGSSVHLSLGPICKSFLYRQQTNLLGP